MDNHLIKELHMIRISIVIEFLLNTHNSNSFPFLPEFQLINYYSCHYCALAIALKWLTIARIRLCQLLGAWVSTSVRGLVQSPCGKINVIMTLGGGGGGRHSTTALSADFRFSCDYAFLWLNKSRHTSSSVKIGILVTAVSSTT